MRGFTAFIHRRQLAANAFDAHVHHVSARIKVVAPHMLQNLAASKQLAVGTHQIFEQTEFSSSQLGDATPVARLAREPIKNERTYLQVVLAIPRRAPLQRMNASDELFNVEGLG